KFAATYLYDMPKQSTRHKYKSRRERNAETKQKAKTLLLFGAILGILLIIYYWDDWWAYYRTYFM
ncbi:MAG: hypothetical protein AAFN92_18590, partial [Bacteroidota bacterium]